MNVTQITEWSTTLHHYTNQAGEPGSYEITEAAFRVSAFGEDREVVFVSGPELKTAYARDAKWGIKRGRSGTKVWMEDIVLAKMDGRWVVNAVQGRHCGHKASSVVGWWDRIPEAQKSIR